MIPEFPAAISLASSYASGSTDSAVVFGRELYGEPKKVAAIQVRTEGDEIVIVLEGRGEFVQEIGGEERRTPVRPGVAIINPKDVWHTADVQEPLKAIYITPCPGTEHRQR